ncbi:zinc finger CCCH domain-containing protein 34-like isoform X3 [Actinidia eriantha]|uniref:zinc finger CCCH domain-containing protein 34-like isoform X3 n=1 Tax=Actinidia eriantha TaxID=165200 RepID=UPI00258C2193|nr:zinc finger CCCH domain-containing protein 34-like isoform X3 [Actinidia eriantha]
MEGSQSDPGAEWSSPGGETGLEEPMWPLGSGSGVESYPERPDEPDCIYYLRTGFCGYGARCRFNHPQDRSLVVGAMRAGGGEFPERVGQPVCQYYMRTGMCKFGASCKYHHPRQGGGSAIPVVLNISGYPLRPGEKECSYYVKTGQCKFGVTCKFHHPQPAGIQVPAPFAGPLPIPAPASAIYPSMHSPAPSSQQYRVAAGNWPVTRPALIPGSYLQGAYSPVLLPPGMVPFSGWNPYQTPVSSVASPSTQSTVGSAPIYGLTQLSPSAPVYPGAYFPLPDSAGPSSSSQKEHVFPERPGQPECHYYMKTGDCKFGSSCRYHHPPEWSAPKMNFALSLMNLPLRPGAPLCTHYAYNGVCKFGPSCKFDHPMGMLSYSPSASSLADMPVAPYLVGSSMGTLAPSSSSSDLRPELSIRMSSSMSTSSGSVGSIFSRSGPASHPGQQSGQASSPSTASSSTSHGGITSPEVRSKSFSSGRLGNCSRKTTVDQALDKHHLEAT